MSRILIAYNTHEGQTAKIADALAAEARARGHEVDELDVAEDDSSYDFQVYDGFIVGGPINRLHHDAALVDFVVRHLELLDERPSAFFSVSLTAASDEAEHQAAAQKLAQDFFHDTGWHPEVFDCVAGALMYSKYDPVVKQVMRLIAWMNHGPTDTARDYELTDWEGVRRFASDVVATIDEGEAPEPSTLVDRYMPFYDFSVVRETKVEASPARAFEAILEANLATDPLVNALTRLRILPEQLLRRLHGQSAAKIATKVTFGDLLRSEEGPFHLLEVDEGHELLAGAIGQFWKPVITWREVDPTHFARFDEPGFARLAISLRVVPTDDGQSRLVYEARTAATDELARRRFKVYWTLIGRFAGLVMGRGLAAIRDDVARRAG